jgi:hypothetical protein
VTELGAEPLPNERRSTLQHEEHRDERELDEDPASSPATTASTRALPVQITRGGTTDWASVSTTAKTTLFGEDSNAMRAARGRRRITLWNSENLLTRASYIGFDQAVV